MPDIYDQHAKAFEHVSAYVILKDGERVATVAFKFPRDGAGRLWAYVHWLGEEMTRGHAGGYGYDKRTAACASAVHKAGLSRLSGYIGGDAFLEALSRDGGDTWDSALRKAGFTVLQAV